MKVGSEVARVPRVHARLARLRIQPAMIRRFTRREPTRLTLNCIFRFAAFPGLDRLSVALKMAIVLVAPTNGSPPIQHERQGLVCGNPLPIIPASQVNVGAS